MNENILTRNLIRLAVFIASLMFFVNMMNGQVVFITDNQYNADYQVFVTDNRYEADWIVYITDNRYEARGGIMYVSSNRYTADYLIYFTSWSSFHSSRCRTGEVLTCLGVGLSNT